MTELQIDNSNAPAVFDDPVNSLDHNIIDDVAKRLFKLSQDRQVIIFTHNVLFLNSLLNNSKLQLYKDVNAKFYNTRNEYQKTGLVSDAEELNTTKGVMSKIEKLINNAPKERMEADVASEGYGHLRSAIELCVEHEILQGAIKRYQKNVALTSFAKVDGIKVNTSKEKLNEIFERCCGFLVGHSNPEEVVSTPTIEELKLDFEDFKTIRKQFV